nr:HD domain-containing protein [Paenibacillus flagellatus]
MEHVASRLERQIAFILEIDKLKHVFRKSRLIRSERFENDAEHTWHLAVMAVLLAEHANEPELDLLKVLKMLLIHDLVEIDAGDTFAYDEKGLEGKYEREKAAADRLFGLLPDDQRDEFQALWEEFEARATAEAAFAAAVDRLQPMLFNYENEGQSWKEHGITSDRVLARNRQIGEGSETLWRYAERMIVEAEKRGFFSNETIEPKS